MTLSIGAHAILDVLMIAERTLRRTALTRYERRAILAVTRDVVRAAQAAKEAPDGPDHSQHSRSHP